jgi:hypothetical protein
MEQVITATQNSKDLAPDAVTQQPKDKATAPVKKTDGGDLSVFIADQNTFKNYPASMSDSEINFDVHTAVRGNTPEDYHVNFGPLNEIQKSFDYLMIHGPDFAEQLKQDLSSPMIPALKGVKMALDAEAQHIDPAIKYLVADPMAALGFSKDVNPQAVADTYKPWLQLWQESPIGAKAKAINEDYKAAADKIPDQNPLLVGPMSIGANNPQVVPWFITEFVPDSLLQMTKISSWVGMYGIEKFGPPVINAVLQRSGLDKTFPLFKEAVSIEKTLAPHYETLGLSPNANMSSVEKAYKQASKVTHPDYVGGDGSEFIKVKAAYDAITKARMAWYEKLFDFLKSDSEARAKVKGLLTNQKGSIPILPEKGDLVKVGSEIGKVLKIAGKIATVNIAGKILEFPIEKLQGIFKSEAEHKAAFGDPMYHGTTADFKEFDTKQTGMGQVWFTGNKAEIANGTSGAGLRPGAEVKVHERYLKPGIKLATPELEDKFTSDQLIQQGYRGVRYPAEGDTAAWTSLYFPNEDTITPAQIKNEWQKSIKSKNKPAEDAPQIVKQKEPKALSKPAKPGYTDISVALSSATKEIPGIAALHKAAGKGDVMAHRLLQDIAQDAIKHLTSGIPSVKIEYKPTTGLYGGGLEPSLGMKVSFEAKDKKNVLAALAKFGDNFSQEQVHVRSAPEKGTEDGHKYADGSYNTTVRRFELNNDLSRADIEKIVAESKIVGFTVGDKYLETYFLGDPSNEAEVTAYKQSVRKATELLSGSGSRVGRSRQRLWPYNNGNGPLGYGSIRGNLPATTQGISETSQRIAARLAGRKVSPVDPAKALTAKQADTQRKIASAYEAMPLNDLANPKVRKAYESLAKELKTQFEALPVKVELWDKAGQPYASSAEMRQDVLDNNHLYIFKTDAATFGPPGVVYNDHPLLRDSTLKDMNGNDLLVNDLLRAVHDYYAHTMSAAEFGVKGEEAAWRNHMAMTTDPYARWALTSETRGQNSWVNFNPAAKNIPAADKPYALQKVGLLPHEFAKTGDPFLDQEMDKAAAAKVSSKNPTLNMDRLDLNDAEKAQLNKGLEDAKKEIESVVGVPITNEEVIQAAKMAKVFDSAQSRQATLDFLASTLRTRQHMAALAQGKDVSKEFLESILKVKALSSDAGRTLQAASIDATPELYDTKVEVLNEILRLGHNIDDVVAAAKGVNFENQNELAAFYRKFVKPKLGEMLDEYVYINILSSPLTHIKNIFSNITQMLILNPADKLASGAYDMVSSGLTGKARQHYFSQVPAFYKGAINALPKAMDQALVALKGETKVERPELKHLPTLSKAVNWATLGVGKYIPRALEAGDVFFRTMIQSGEEESLTAQLGHAPNEDELLKIQNKAADKAAEYIFRKPLDPSNEKGQGHLLSYIDKVTSGIMQFRRNVPGFKWFFRFVETPMNILKSGIEHSPLGFANMWGSKDKADAAGKAIVGSMIFAGASFMAASGRTTWAAPRGKKEKEAFEAAGLLPYSIIIGDTCVSFQNIGPIAYPIAMAAALHHFTSESADALTDSDIEKIVSSMSGIMGFFADQSYMSGMKDLVNAASGEKSKAISSIPTQLIPLSSLQGWVNNVIDPIQRKIEKKITIDSVVDNIQSKVIGMSQFVPEKLNEDEMAVKKQNRFINAISPMKISKINKAALLDYREMIQNKQEDNLSKKEN